MSQCIHRNYSVRGEKRSCDTSLLFYRNTGVEGKKMEEILKKYMNRFTTLSEEEQQMILSELQIEEYKKEQCS